MYTNSTLRVYICSQDVVKIFGFEDADTADDVIYANWLSLCHAAIKGVEMYRCKRSR